MEKFDLVVIGGGPAGYTAAIRASQLGMKVACIEKNTTLGGTCLNVGCIPSKALLHFSQKYEDSKKHFPDIGIETNISLNLQKMIEKKDHIVRDLCKGIESLFIKNKIKKIIAHAKIINSNTVELQSEGKHDKIEAQNILIATGSKILNIPNVEIDEQTILSSSGALSLQKIPEKLVVIGAGYIGLELGSVWRRLGSEVVVVEFGDKILPAMDSEIATNLMKILLKQGMKFELCTKIISSEINKQGKVLSNLKQIQTQQTFAIESDALLISVGRIANTLNLGLEEAGIKVNDKGQINVNSQYQTSISNIYAVGDVIEGPMLAHKAEEEAIAAVEIMNNQAGHVNYHLIPSVIYTSPEVASVGYTEDELKKKQINYKVGKFPFMANSRARAMCQTEGMVKMLACAKTDSILGAHIIGSDAGSLIAELVAYMEFGASAEDIARTCHAHPTLNEAIKEAALAIDKRTINL